MKTQMTAIAAAITLAMSASAFAETQPASPQFDVSRGTINGMAGASYDGSGSGNDSFIYQSGNDNNTSVTQWGTQESRIRQIGSDNTANVTQDDVVGGSGPGRNYSMIEQRDRGNRADVSQVGEENDSIVDQEAGFRGWAYNYANVIQDGYRNDSWVQQDGFANKSSIVQKGDLNDSYVLSEGSFNVTYTTQNGDELDSDIISRGDRNYTAVTQNGYGHDSYVLTQGSGNTHYVNQVGVQGAGQHFSEIQTYGHNNYNIVNQGN